MNILLLGSGGREHALAWKISQSPRLTRLFIAPGNAGTALSGTNVNMAADDFNAVGEFAIQNKIGMVVVGPEDPLVKGISDYFLQQPALQHIPVIGPSKQAAMLEGSKDFAKAFMIRHAIPTARYKSVTLENIAEGFAFLNLMTAPYVLKADGLAAGKGVLIVSDLADAREELKNMLAGKFGNAGNTVVIEEFLTGIELSVFVITDGRTYKILPEAKDYKRAGEADTGPNTGGMGAVSPVPFATSSFMKKVEDRIIIPTVNGLQSEGIEYKGFIFFGLINCQDDPYVIEYNARLGDPESEVILPRLQTDIVSLLEGVANKTLAEVTVTFDERYVTTVMLASGGYPGSYEKGKIITGLDRTSGSLVFHAGTKADANRVVTNGGRVIAVSSFGSNMKEALSLCYRNAGIINFEKKYMRTDIGFDLQ
ncbi:MAG TPA: phosphoribosylamine--glycine ligase [Bacteroidales bacterium]|nr:phosphoribosylamine--glycine ligase [Bacteroidales bacterium]